ncbi:MAG: DEAD/DEAH box helicase [Hyphomicrobium sp.]|nr:DEAD/DEAH box helicase [Hyphomicrobium sp.]
METLPFAELGLSPKVLAAVEASGYTTATPIQSQAIPVALTGKDVLGIAQTGTGKTAAFTLPMITRLETGRARARMPRSLILAPTRELAAQVAQAFEKYGINHKLDVALLIGGVSMDDQVKKLDRGVDVLIATPGRLLDHFGRGRIMLMGVEILVIDEADRMLDMGFIPDIEKICKLLPPRRQTLFFSATMPPEITRLVQQFLKDPVRIEVAKQATTAKTITQRFCFCPASEDWAKRDMLRNLIRSQTIQNGIIFCNRKRDVAVLHKSLVKHGFNAGALHGDMDQRSRMETLDKFRAGEITLLAASDVAARGLDIPEVSHVFNFDLPWHSEDYVHRIGRTGRAGREGAAFSIVTLEDLKLLKDIQKITGDTAEWVGEQPTPEDFENAGKRRRGRGGPAKSDGRGASARSDGQSGQRRDGRGSRPARDGRNERPARGGERRPEGRDAAHRTEAPMIMDAPAVEARAGGPSREAHSGEHSGRRDRGPRRERSDRPDRTSHERPDRPERSDRPQRQDRPERVLREATEQRSEPRQQPAHREPAARPVQDQRPAQRPAARSASVSASAGGFAENVPAFLRRPARPAKVGSE